MRTAPPSSTCLPGHPALRPRPRVQLPDMQPHETDPFVQSLNAVPKSGRHNPMKHPERCARCLPCWTAPLSLPRQQGRAGQGSGQLLPASDWALVPVCAAV